MRYIVFFLSFFAAIALSQETAGHNDVVICYDISHSGFIEVNETTFDNFFFSLQRNRAFTTPHSITISGIVNSVSSETAKILDANEKKIGLPVMGIENIDSMRNKINRMKVVSLKRHKVFNSPGSDSLMQKAFNPQRVYVPQSLNITPGDSISITNYAAFINDTCYIGDDSHQKAFVFGNFKVH